MTKRGLGIACGFLLLGFAWGAVAALHDLPPFRQVRAMTARTRLAPWLAAPAAAPLAGRFHPAAKETNGEDVRRELEQLRGLGYLAGSEPPSGTAGVTVVDPGRTQPGVNLAIDGHAPEATLFDMEGRELHRWSFRHADAFPDQGPPTSADADAGEYWRKVRLTGNGNLLAIYEGLGLIKIDRDSRLLWAYPRAAHHDLDEGPDGSVYVLTRDAGVVPEIHPSRPVLHDYIDLLDAGGRELRRVSVLRAILRSSYASLLRLAPGHGDILHTNGLQILDGSLADRLPAFREGNVLVSLPQIDTIAVIDMDAEAVVWAATGLWRFQHQPRLLATGHVLVFDNCGGTPSDARCPGTPDSSADAQRGRSRVIEMDPVTQRIAWLYDDPDLFSRHSGACQRLPNGNTLVVESNRGHAFEVTAAKDTVWAYRTPHRAGEGGEMIATLFDLVRIPEAGVRRWLRAGSGQER